MSFSSRKFLMKGVYFSQGKIRCTDTCMPFFKKIKLFTCSTFTSCKTKPLMLSFLSKTFNLSINGRQRTISFFRAHGHCLTMKIFNCSRKKSYVKYLFPVMVSARIPIKLLSSINIMHANCIKSA